MKPRGRGEWGSRACTGALKTQLRAWAAGAMGPEGHSGVGGEFSVGVGQEGGGSGGSGHALEPLKLSSGPLVEGWGHGTMGVGPWHAGAMKP